MKLQSRFRMTGASILVLGLLASVYVYKTRPVEERNDIIGYDILSKRQLDELEKYGGKANVAATDFMTWLGDLWHGRKVADTILVLSVAGACGCFFLGQFLSDPVDEADPNVEK